MAFAALRFPEDMPWTRLCVTESMMDAAVCDGVGPPRWRSSVAVFTHEPAEADQVQPGWLVSYLKVAITLTNYQPSGAEIGVPDSAWNALPAIDNFAALDRSYPCYGALLSVTVGPHHGAQVALADYPFFADFEPKKRELVELVSTTGERASRSLEEINVKNGTTTVDSTEAVDTTSFGASLGVPIGGANLGLTGQSQSSTRRVHSDERVDVRTRDAIEEARNTTSRTTNLTQMHTMLQSFHLGTNRALFVVQPRPHVVQSEVTFINGPRQLEGIQEIFLVVVRPAGQAAPCVKVDLETAHLGMRAEMVAEEKTESLSLSLRGKVTHPDAIRTTNPSGASLPGSVMYVAPSGWEVVDWGEESAPVRQGGATFSVEHAPDHVTIRGLLRWDFDLDWSTARHLLEEGRLEVKLWIRVRRWVPSEKQLAESLFLTGRSLCCCPARPGERLRLPEWVVATKDIGHLDIRFEPGAASADRMLAVRRTTAVLADEVVKLSRTRLRHAAGEVHLFETDQFQRSLAEHLRRYDQGAGGPSSDFAALPEKLRARYGPRDGRTATMADYLAVPAQELARLTHRSVVEVLRERLRHIVGSHKQSAS